ncbi:hypothetical protein O6H91_11G118700 [Diphasiastrum complanatum]|uniref:Uncharacterized protein n=2 Tax=Diphasiastrum complanatum TaxID=34168 RepID=A0ACC2CD86_DIPCM|nr:hypothetical protein O6H91_11G118700 [Diphasiastrum complanatum]KAJ7540013.1 hypothetical protein O6H91_11G118700 [Diphasiastrum complanatum]
MAEHGGDSEANADPLQDLVPSIEGLYLVRDTFFPRDPAEKRARLDKAAKDILLLLDSISLEHRRQLSRRAFWEYSRGKVLDVGQDYCKEAEDHLSKAIKLDPSLVDAWSCLGNCYWKKGDQEALISAKRCFIHGLRKGPNKRILQQLSMLERRLARGSSNEVETVEESIMHAKQAVELDVKDGQSWYILGNAYFTSFSTSGAWDRNKLLQALKAYQIAEKDAVASANPDLHYNSAAVYQYLEDFERALKSFEAAGLRDPGLHADEEINKLVKLLAKLEDFSLNKGRVKPKKFAAILASLNAETVQTPSKGVTLRNLKEGVNKGVAVNCKVLVSVPHAGSLPLFYVVADSEESCFALSVYSVRDTLIKESDSVTLLEPLFKNVAIHWQTKIYSFKSVRIDHPQQLLLNDCPVSVQDAVCSMVHADHVPS